MLVDEEFLREQMQGLDLPSNNGRDVDVEKEVGLLQKDKRRRKVWYKQIQVGGKEACSDVTAN